MHCLPFLLEYVTCPQCSNNQSINRVNLVQTSEKCTCIKMRVSPEEELQFPKRRLIKTVEEEKGAENYLQQNTALHMSSPLLAVICRSHAGLLPNEKEEKIHDIERDIREIKWK